MATRKTAKKSPKKESKKPLKKVRKVQSAKKKPVKAGTKKKTVAVKSLKKPSPAAKRKRVVSKREKPKTKQGAAQAAKKTLRPKKTRGSKAVSKKTLSLQTASRQDLLRRQLIARREDIVREAKTEIAKYISGEANQLVETALDDGDWSVIDLSEDVNLKRLQSHRLSLLNIDEALRKLREGTYGTCEDCGEEISADRLRVMPFAILCRDCQEKQEEIEKATREDII